MNRYLVMAMRKPESVSYTHLDVYKRQDEWVSLQQLQTYSDKVHRIINDASA